MAGDIGTVTWKSRNYALTLLLPFVLINAAGFVLPMLNLARMSFNEALPGGGIREAFVLDNWTNLVRDPFYIELISNSMLISFGVALSTLLVSYPIALYIHRASGTWRTFLVFLVFIPMLTSAVVRTYGWIAVLSSDGPVANTLRAFGMVEPPRLLFSTTGVVIGLTQILMPLMILSLLAGFGRLDPRIEEAARTLGATRFQIFRKVILPLTRPGIALGTLLCFISTISSFVTPRLMGGGRVFLLATEIYDQAIVTLNWPLASTLSLLVLILFGGVIALYARIMKSLD